MAKVKNISRTLVLEKFNDKPCDESNHPLSLVLALRDAIDADDGSFNYRAVDIKGLEVKNFNEFLEKFAPDIYQGFQTDDNGGYFVYSTDPERYPGSLKMKFERTAFYKAAIDLYEKKAVDGKSNYEFDYSCFSKLISPETALKEVKSKRRELEYSMRKMLEAKDSKNSALESQYKKKVLNTANEIKETYKDNPTALLCLSVADLQVKLGINSDDDDKGTNNPSNQITQRTTYQLTYNADGDIVKERINTDVVNSPEINSANLLETRINDQTVKLLEQKVVNSNTDSDGDKYAGNLVVSAYSGNTGIIASEDIPKLQKRYNIQKACYKAAQDSLLKAINKIIEKMIDVKALFDNAGEDFSVIIANCTAEDIVNEKDTKEYFEKYMKNINANIDAKIWFAVLPQIDDDDLVDRDCAGKIYTPDIPDVDSDDEEVIIDVEFEKEQDNSTYDDSDDISWDDDETETQKQNLISLSSAKQMLDILDKSKCLTFFGFKGCEKTGFGKMNKARLDTYKKKLSGIESRYSIFAYPNFTLMSGIQAGDIQVAPGETIQNPGLYLDAPYIAAGLTIKSLNSRELEKLKFKVHKDLPFPCVRFDFEDSSDEYNNRYKVISNMNCEEILKYDNDLLEALDDEPFGFFFDSCGYQKGTKVKHAFVKYSRNLAKNENRIFATLVKDFIWLEMVNGELRIGKKVIDDYKANNKWSRDTYNDCINNPLRHGEDYGYKETEGKTVPYIHFNGGVDNDRFDDFEIIDDTEE